MKYIDKLIDSAEEMTQNGLSQGEVADELNVSRETASWLVAQSGPRTTEGADAESPTDVHVDWSAIGRDGHRLSYLGAIMADLLSKQGDDVDLTVGIGKSGGPLATVVSQELGTDLSVYMPGKYQWNDDENGTVSGSFSRSFATIEGRDCYVVDDNVDTGRTMTETIEQIRDHGGTPRASAVITDKLGRDEIEGVPIHALVKIVQMTDE
ncbi:orotate phosphoribosyltransferase-like protein [Halomicroarcula sp. F13]|uniref:Transcriptional regulator GfcR n=1 Tax=Haloarcula rubra TaxID=2487747 RepID=A0AAW4PMN9_9EURY|nr:transcriptional regulator GfcR [Halomicroarcula rubra]MBX0322021.1 orotate phosphoribosyltransferase-like protein [Halomicroarcula rubra]